MTVFRPAAATLASVFKNVSDEDLARLQKIFHERRFRAGEAVFMQGDEPNAIYLVAKGRVNVERVTREGQPCLLCIRGPGAVFCPVPLLDKGRQLGTAWAMTEVVLLWAGRDEFSAICESCPGLMAEVQKDCLLEVRRLLGRMESLTFHNVWQRVAITLLEESQRQADYDSKPLNELRITQQELAGLVGASRESVSRALSRLGDDGIVEPLRGRVIIRDRVKLRALAQGDSA